MPVVKGIVEDGVIRPTEKLPLRDGEEVEIRYPLAACVDQDEVRRMIERMDRGIDFAGWRWRGRDDLHDRQGLR